MKRPVAVAGVTYLLSQLLAAFLPQAAVWLLAAFFVLLFIVLRTVSSPKKLYQTVGIVACTICCALSMRGAHYVVSMRPVQSLEGSTHVVAATVLDAAEGYLDGTMRVTLQITDFTDDTKPQKFKATANNFPEVKLGEQITFTAAFSALEENDYLLSNYAKGIYIEVEPLGALQHGEQQYTLLLVGKYVQQGLSETIFRYLQGDVGAIAAAMAVGDKTHLTSEIKEAFRAAGLSHALVVSGLHLSLLSGAVYAALRRFRQKRTAALGSIAVTILFLLIAGFTPSLVRAAVAVLLCYTAMLLSDAADAFTSLGFAALVLCVQNPYAAADTGLLLSFLATAAVLCVTAAIQNHQAEEERGAFSSHIKGTLLSILAIPLATTIATLPVISAIGGGVSLLSVLCNILALPLLSIIVICGMLLGLLGLIPVLEPLARLCGLAGGLAAKTLYAIAQGAQRVPWAVVHITSVAAVLAIWLTVALIYLGRRAGMPWRKNMAFAAVFLLLCGVGYTVLDAEVVRVAFIGSGVNQSVVVTNQLDTAVLFRGQESTAAAVQSYLKQNNRTKVNLLVDLRRTGDTAALAESLHAQQILRAEELINHTNLQPFHGIMVSVNHQVKGNYASVDIDGYVVGAASGTVDMAAYPVCTVFAAGGSKPLNLNCDIVLLPPKLPAWATEIAAAKNIRHTTPETILMLRTGRSAVWKGVNFDTA